MNATKVKRIWTANTLAYKMAHACNTEWMGRKGLMFPNSIDREYFRLIFGVRNMGTVWNNNTKRREKKYPQRVVFKQKF
jgi:hypothetical protein